MTDLTPNQKQLVKLSHLVEELIAVEGLVMVKPQWLTLQGEQYLHRFAIPNQSELYNKIMDILKEHRIQLIKELPQATESALQEAVVGGAKESP